MFQVFHSRRGSENDFIEQDMSGEVQLGLMINYLRQGNFRPYLLKKKKIPTCLLSFFLTADLLRAAWRSIIQVLESDSHKTQCHYFIAMSPGTSHLTCRNLSFLIYKMGEMQPSSQGGDKLDINLLFHGTCSISKCFQN